MGRHARQHTHQSRPAAGRCAARERAPPDARRPSHAHPPLGKGVATGALRGPQPTHRYVVDGDEDELRRSPRSPSPQSPAPCGSPPWCTCRARARGERVSGRGCGGEGACKNDGRHSSREGSRAPRVLAQGGASRVPQRGHDATQQRRSAAAGERALRAALPTHPRARRAGRCCRHSCVPARGGGRSGPSPARPPADRGARRPRGRAREQPLHPRALARPALPRARTPRRVAHFFSRRMDSVKSPGLAHAVDHVHGGGGGGGPGRPCARRARCVAVARRARACMLGSIFLRFPV